MIAELQDERHKLDEAIEALERLSAGQTRRRGRPSRSSEQDSNDGSSISHKPGESSRARASSENVIAKPDSSN